jgi:hypothetical protein
MRPTLKNVGRGMPYLHPTMIVRKEVFNKTSRFKKEFGIAMDYDWIVRLTKKKLEGYYLDMNAPVKMDGTGLSVVEEGEAIRECFNILKENNYLNFANLYGFTIRYLLFLLRSFLSSVGLNKLLNYLKKMKHSR